MKQMMVLILTQQVDALNHFKEAATGDSLYFNVALKGRLPKSQTEKT